MIDRAAAALQRLWWRPRPAGAAPRLASAVLWPLAALHGALAALHRALYRGGWRRAARAPRPLLVVGNLVVGGAGKTPTVIALVQALRAAGWTPGVVSRGHGRRGEGSDVPLAVTPNTPAALAGDEPLLIARRSGAPVAVGRDRAAAARLLCEARPEVDLLIADDGLQHHRLARDAQVIVFDERGAGNGRLLPAGPLREPLPAAVPPRSVLLYNAPSPSTPLPGFVAARALAGACEWADWRRGAPPSRAALQALRGRPLLALAGMAHPERFFAMLEAEGLQIDRLPLPDHAPAALLRWPAGTPDVLVTEKDAVKLDPAAFGGSRVWVVALHRADRIVNSLEGVTLESVAELLGNG